MEDKPVPARFFVTGYFVEADIIEVRKLTIFQFVLALVTSQLSWWYYSVILILKRIGLLDLPHGVKPSISNFTFSKWIGKIKRGSK